MGLLRDYWALKQREKRERDSKLAKIYGSESRPGESFSDFRKRMKGKSLT